MTEPELDAARLLRSRGWTVVEPIEYSRSMSDEDRDKAIELLHASSAEMLWEDRKSASDDMIDAVLGGYRGLVEFTDEELLDELRVEYDDSSLNDAEELVTDEKLRLWAKYRKPDMICSWCGGSGEAAHASDPAAAFDREDVAPDNLPKCSLCEGTGVGAMFRSLPGVAAK